MNESLRNAIDRHSQSQVPAILQFIQDVYGQDISEETAAFAFVNSHRGISLPDEIFMPDPTKSIGVSLHKPVINGWLHSHDFFELIYVAEGNVIDKVDGDELHLSKGSVCVHNPRAMHQIVKCDGSDCLVNLMIRKNAFRQNVFLPIAQEPALSKFFLRYETLQDNPNYMLFHSNDARIGTILDLIAEEFLDRQSNETLLTSMVFLLFGTLLKTCRTNSFVDQLTQYISEHMEAATLPECAAYFGYHDKYFSSMIRKKLGKTFKQLLTEMRIRKAEGMLLYTDRSISDIACSVGYSEPPVFYANFKKNTGMTPTEFRKRG